MPSLAFMRSIDPAGAGMQPLGPAIRQPTKAPEPANKPTATPGVYEKPDGKLITNLPTPPSKPAAKLAEQFVIVAIVHDSYITTSYDPSIDHLSGAGSDIASLE